MLNFAQSESALWHAAYWDAHDASWHAVQGSLEPPSVTVPPSSPVPPLPPLPLPLPPSSPKSTGPSVTLHPCAPTAPTVPSPTNDATANQFESLMKRLPVQARCAPFRGTERTLGLFTRARDYTAGAGFP